MTDTPRQPGILIADDDPIVVDSMAELLQERGWRTATACDGYEAMQMLRDAGTDGFGLLIADLNMPRLNGLELIRRVRERHPSLVSLVITGYGTIESAVEAVKLGAFEYLTKPIVDDELLLAVEKAFRQHALVAENAALKSQLAERYGLENLVGSDYRMQKTYDLVEAVAESKTTVLVHGESGTGKSMVARAVHERSPRRTGPFVTFACGSIPETLLESELFGHVKGAFTGAASDKPGKLRAAEGGTLFLDEINSATPALQLKLLRVLQERQFEPVGSHETVKADVRFVLATNQPLMPLVRAGQFREDLYYRINVVSIELPPLRQRQGDVRLLLDHFLDKYCREVGKVVTGVSAEAFEALRRYQWPGNVRELENAVERAVVLSNRPQIDLDDLPDAIRYQSPDGEPGFRERRRNPTNWLPPDWSPLPLRDALRDPERRIILAALEANNWNRQQTAKVLDIDRTTLYKKIKQYRLDEPVNVS